MDTAKFCRNIKRANEAGKGQWFLDPKFNNPRQFTVSMIGPKSTPFEGGIFFCEIFFPEGYPIYPPKVIMITKIFHPNYCDLPREHYGKLYTTLLYENYRMELTITDLIQYIYSLFMKPDLDRLSIANREAADCYLYQYKKYVDTAVEYTAKYAK